MDDWRKAQQFTDERLLKLEKRVDSLGISTTSITEQLVKTDAKIDGVAKSLEQYTGVLDEIKGALEERLQKMNSDLHDAFDKQSEALKLYLNQRVPQTTPGTSSGTGGSLWDKFGDRIPDTINRAIDGFLGNSGIPGPSSTSTGDPISREIVDLNREFENALRLAWRDNLRQNLVGLRTKVGLAPSPVTEAVRVVHQAGRTS